MKQILLLLILIAVPVVGWAEPEWTITETKTKYNCHDDSEGNQHCPKSKRQEYLDKCNHATSVYEECREHSSWDCHKFFEDQQTYCLRASLEE